MSAGPTETKIKSVHVNTERGFGGGEVQTLGLLSCLNRGGNGAVLAAPPKSRLYGLASKAGLKCYPFRAFLGEIDLLAALRLRAIIAREKPDIIHAHTAHALALALLARGWSQRPKVVGSRRVSFALKSGFSLKKYLRADALIAVSEAVSKVLLDAGIPKERVAVIHSGVDLSRFKNLPDRASARKALGISDEARVIGLVSTLSRHKGCGVFLKAFRQVWMNVSDACAIIVGEGDMQGTMERACAWQNTPVTFMGFIQEPEKIMPALDVLIMPALSGEGSSGVIKEAAAAGVPVVATDVGGTSEILRNDVEAVIVLPNNPDELAAGIIKVLKNWPLADRLSSAAKKRVSSFSMEEMGSRTLEVYRRILSCG